MNGLTIDSFHGTISDTSRFAVGPFVEYDRETIIVDVMHCSTFEKTSLRCES